MDEIEKILHYTDRIELKHSQGWYTATAYKGEHQWQGRALSLERAHEILWETFLDAVLTRFEVDLDN